MGDDEQVVESQEAPQAPPVEVEVPESTPAPGPDQATEPEPGPGPAPEPAPAEAAPEPEPEPGIFDGLYDTLFARSWQMWVGAVLLAFFSVVLFLVASPWGSSGGLQNLGMNLFDRIGLDLSTSAPNGVTAIAEHRYAMLSIMMLMGALGSALMAKEFAIRVAPKGELLKGLLGGLLMGVGAVLAIGCTIGGFFSAWPALSGAGLVFLLGLVLGTFIAVRYLLWEMEAAPGMSSGKSYTFLAPAKKRTSLQPLAGAVVLGLGAFVAMRYDTSTQVVLIGFVLVGLMVGFILQRSRFCIVRALREPFLGGDSRPTVAIIAGVLVGIVGFVTIKILGLGSETAMVAGSFWVPAIIGGTIFGFGMTIAGGCTVGATWRAGEGHVKLWMALVGIIIAMPLTAEYVKTGFMAGLPASLKEAVFLPDTLGYGGAVTLMLLVLFVWYVIVKWNERTGKLAAF